MTEKLDISIDREKRHCGLVMEGGAMRGLFTCGVFDVFLERGLVFDGAAGTSAGATFGCNIKSGQFGRPLRYNKRFCSDRRYSSLSSLLLTGDLYNADFCYETLPFELDIWDEEAFSSNPMEFFVVCTDVESGRPVYYRCDRGGREDILWIRASASMPLFAKIVEIDGRKFLDGGIADSVAIRFMQDIGYGKNVVIRTRPRDFVRKKSGMTALMKAVYHKYPRFIEAAEKRHIVYNETAAYLRAEEEAGRVFMICPPEELPVGRVEKDPEKLQLAYDIGREEGLKAVDAIIEGGFCRVEG